MKLTNEIKEIILGAEAKALATSSTDTINVVSVSTVKIINDEIILVNYFMGKTLKNLKENPQVALACWKGLEGCQIKGSIRHIESGELFENIKDWVKEILPNRIVKGILILTPEEVFDISATAENAGNKIL